MEWRELFRIYKSVVATEPEFMDGYEVVKVKFNESIISKNELNKYAKNKNSSFHSTVINSRLTFFPL